MEDPLKGILGGPKFRGWTTLYFLRGGEGLEVGQAGPKASLCPPSSCAGEVLGA